MAGEATPPATEGASHASEEEAGLAATGVDGDGDSKQAGPDTADARQQTSRGDAWFVYAVSLGAIAIPVITLFTINYLHTDHFRWDDVATSFDRGDFLVPVLILAADTIRRMWREASCAGLLSGFRLLATVVCTVFCIACFAGVVAATGTTTATERTALGQLTVSALVVGLVFGTVAMGLPLKRAGQD